MSLPNGHGSLGSENGSEHGPPLFSRLASTARRRAHAAGNATATALSGAKDGLESFRDNAKKLADRMDQWAADGAVGRTFQFKERSAKFTSELRAGLITFLMVSYILVVNPSILITTGGTCDPQTVCAPEAYDLLGPQCLANPGDPGAMACMNQLARSLITATAASSLISTFFIGFFGNLPLALAPGIGITAYVSYQVVGQYGTGQLSFSQTMTAVFVEGFIFMVLSVSGVRGGIIKYMPKSIALASSVGIGMLLAFTGLRSLGLIVYDSATLLTLGGCPNNRRNYLYAFDAPITPTSFATLNFTSLPPPASVYGCVSDSMRSPTMWLGVAGGFLMAILLYMGVKGSLILGIFFITIISWIPGHGASYLGASSPIPGGEARLEVFKQVVAAPTLEATGLAWDWSAFNDGKLWLALFTFLYIDLLDCTGTLLSMARLMDFYMPGFLSDSSEFPGQMWAFLSDGIGIVSGSMMGTTSLTVFIESAAGIEDGGRTGLTAVVVSFFFLASLFFSPIIASIPPYATGPALVLVGTILLGHITHIEWDDIGVAIPAFLTVVLMPFTYSVAYGVIAGLVSYIAIHAPFWAADYIRRRWWPSSAASSPRSMRARRRSKTGYHMRKTFGPAPDPPSRADSFVGGPWYDDSYHTQDTRRSALPTHLLPPGAAAAAGSTHASVQAAGRSAPPSVVNLFFPESSVRGGGATGSGRAVQMGGYGRSGSSHGDGEAAAVRPLGGTLYRKSYSMHSPGRSETPGRGGGLGNRTLNRSLTDMAAAAEVAGLQAGASPGRDRRSSSPQPRSASPRPGLPLGRTRMQRSRTFSHGISNLGAADELELRHSSSAHGGDLFKLFPDAPDLAGSADSGGAGGVGSASFKLFGDVEPLPLEPGEERPGGGGGGGDQPFRLFGDVEPLELRLSCGEGEERRPGSPTFPLASSPLCSQDRADTADLTFGGTSPPKEHQRQQQQQQQQQDGQQGGPGAEGPPPRDSLQGGRRGGAAPSDAELQELAQQASLDAAAAAAVLGEARPSLLKESAGAAAAAAGARAAAAGAAVAAAGAAAAAAATRRPPSQPSSLPGAAGDASGGLRPSQAAWGGSTASTDADAEIVYSRLMRTLSSRSLRGAAPGSGGSEGGAHPASATASIHGGARSSLRSASLAAAAAQLAAQRRDSQGQLGAEGSAATSAAATPAGTSPDGTAAVLAAQGSPQLGAARLQQAPSPFDAPQTGRGGPGASLGGAAARRQGSWLDGGRRSGVGASRRMSGAPSDDEQLD